LNCRVDHLEEEAVRAGEITFPLPLNHQNEEQSQKHLLIVLRELVGLPNYLLGHFCKEQPQVWGSMLLTLKRSHKTLGVDQQQGELHSMLLLQSQGQVW
jgi:hypothetical protein